MLGADPTITHVSGSGQAFADDYFVTLRAQCGTDPSTGETVGVSVAITESL